MRMLRFWIAASVALVALSGCLDDSDDAEPTLDETPEVAVDEIEPRSTSFSCDTLVGAVVVTINDIGGCILGDTTHPGVAMNITTPGGCSVQYDANGDGQADGEVTEGSLVESGWGLVVFCGPGSSGSSSLDVVEQIAEAMDEETE